MPSRCYERVGDHPRPASGTIGAFSKMWGHRLAQACTPCPAPRGQTAPRPCAARGSPDAHCGPGTERTQRSANMPRSDSCACTMSHSSSHPPPARVCASSAQREEYQSKWHITLTPSLAGRRPAWWDRTSRPSQSLLNSNCKEGGDRSAEHFTLAHRSQPPHRPRPWRPGRE